MASLRGRTVKVAGAGALGLAVAVDLAEAGAAVTVHDPADGSNASAVAAGMLAPAFEAVLDPVSAGHFALYRAARDLWPDFAARTGVVLDRSGAVYEGGRGDAVAGALERIGARFARHGEGVATQEDWRLDADVAITRLRAAALARGVLFDRRPLDDAPGGEAVAATGWRPVGWAPESACITPIKGQIFRAHDGPGEGPVRRFDVGYLAPSAGGPLIGATMEPGRSDLEPDGAIEALVAQVAPPGLKGTVAVGIRGATPDALPLVGPSAAPGVWLAMGARRNGWLLAPLVAAMTRAYLAGDDPGPWAEQLNARRFAATDLEE